MSTFVYLTAAVPASGAQHGARGAWGSRFRSARTVCPEATRRPTAQRGERIRCAAGGAERPQGTGARGAAPVVARRRELATKQNRWGARARSARRPRDRGGSERDVRRAARRAVGAEPCSAAPALSVGCDCPPEGAPKRLPLCPMPGGNPVSSIARFPRRCERGGQRAPMLFGPTLPFGAGTRRVGFRT